MPNFHNNSEDPPRKWIIPKPNISKKDFKRLIQKRSKTLLKIQANRNDRNSSDVGTTSLDAAAGVGLRVKENKSPDAAAGVDLGVKGTKSPDAAAGVDLGIKENKSPDAAAGVDLGVKEAETSTATRSDKEKERKEIKERLETMYENKHSLVQLLKQIQDAEEQIKKQRSNQGNSGRPPLPPQVKTTGTDSGGMTRADTPKMALGGITRTNTPKMASGESSCSQRAVNESNPNLQSRPVPWMNSATPLSGSQQVKTTGTDSGGMTRIDTSKMASGRMTRPNTPKMASGESSCSQRAVTDTNPNLQSHPVPRMNSATPLSSSQQRTHSYRASVAVAGSPSRYTPTTTGRDVRQPSPWRDMRPPSPWRDARQASPWRDARQASPWRDYRRHTPSRFAPTSDVGQRSFWMPSPRTIYIASSSPRPASDDGTPDFRDPRLPSPWRDARPPSPWS